MSCPCLIVLVWFCSYYAQDISSRSVNKACKIPSLTEDELLSQSVGIEWQRTSVNNWKCIGLCNFGWAAESGGFTDNRGRRCKWIDGFAKKATITFFQNCFSRLMASAKDPTKLKRRAMQVCALVAARLPRLTPAAQCLSLCSSTVSYCMGGMSPN